MRGISDYDAREMRAILDQEQKRSLLRDAVIEAARVWAAEHNGNGTGASCLLAHRTLEAHVRALVAFEEAEKR